MEWIIVYNGKIFHYFISYYVGKNLYSIVFEQFVIFFLIVNGIYKDDQSSFIELAMLIYGCCSRLNKILKKPI